MTTSAFSIESLQYMMMYAWNMWPVSSTTYLGSSTNAVAPLDRLAYILADCIVRAEKSGLTHEYITSSEETLLPRGRLQLARTIQLRANRDQRVAVETDEYSVDCRPNRALREAVETFLRSSVGKQVRDRLLVARGALARVSNESLSLRDIHASLLDSRRTEYRIGLSISILLKQSRFFGEDASPLLHESAVINDDVLFRRLYEKFLREFYRFNLRNHVVGGRQYCWDKSTSSSVPVMQTDINIEDQTSVFVIDAKCTHRSLISRENLGGRWTLNSNHLYQMFAYMAYAGAQNPGKSIAGILLYPEYDHSVDETIDTRHGPLRAKTINFSGNWESVCSQLLDVLPH